MTDKPNLADARRAVVMRVVIRARCYECAWTETGPDADKEAEQHMKRTGHHSTGTRSTPIHADAMSAPVREGQK